VHAGAQQLQALAPASCVADVVIGARPAKGDALGSSHAGRARGPWQEELVTTNQAHEQQVHFTLPNPVGNRLLAGT
jgi:hypothetical protein